MPPPITPELIKLMAAQLRALAVSDRRAAELAVDVERIHSATRAEAERNNFNDEPGRYAVALAALKNREQKR